MPRRHFRTADAHLQRELSFTANEAPPWRPPAFHLLDETQIEIRPYFEIVFRVWAEDQRVGIVADTSTGKTYLAYALADATLARGGRVIVIAPTTALAAQHAALARSVFRLNDQVILHVRSRTPRIRAAQWSAGRLLVATPQLARNDIGNGRLTLQPGDLVIVDEAHHAAQRHASIEVAAHAKTSRCRLLALTASPGGTQERIERIRRNLGLARWIRIADAETAPFRPPTQVTTMSIGLTDDLRPALDCMGAVLSRLTEYLVKAGHLACASTMPSSRDLQQCMSSVSAASEYATLPFAAAAFQLSVVQQLMVTDDYSVALASLQRALNKRDKAQQLTKTARRLRSTQDVRTIHHELTSLIDRGVLHPKQIVLDGVVCDLLRPVGSRILIFDRYADGVERIADRLALTHPGLVSSAYGRSRMKPDILIERLSEFARGDRRILVATEVVREGIHVPAIDHLIEVSPPRNELELIQLRGRVGRTTPGTVHALLMDHPLDSRFAYSARARARRMRTLLPSETAQTIAEGAAPARSIFHSRPEKKKTGFIAHLRGPLIFERFVIVESCIVRSARRPYVQFLVGDRTGTLPCVHWTPRGVPQAEQLMHRFPSGTIVIISGRLDARPRRIVVNPSQRNVIVACPEDDYNPDDYARTAPF
jgi:ERCC4-related helicase